MAGELTPQQIDFLKYYTDPKSETFSNALQSALKAGYKQEYAENLTHLMPDWLSEAIGKRKRLLEKAEKALEETLDMPTEVVKWEVSGYEDGQKIYEDVVKTEPALVKIKQDTAKFIASTIGKEDGYSTKQEVDLTSKGEKITGINYILPNGTDNTSDTQAA